MEYKTFGGWSEHMHRHHPDEIPESFTDLQYFYYTITGKKAGCCVQCHKPTDWNEATGKYNRYCNNPKCKEQYCKVAKKRMIDKYGKIHLLNDPEMQRKMLSNRKISGTYTFSDGSGKVPYVASYEKDFLMTMDTVLGLKASDIMSPSPHNYVYMYEGKPHFYIPDFYIPSLNLEVEIKDDQNGPNANKHPKIAAVDRVKEALKDEVMHNNKTVNYFKVMDKSYTDFFKYVLDLKECIDDDLKNTIVSAMANESANDPEVSFEMALEHALEYDDSEFNGECDYGFEEVATESMADVGRTLGKSKVISAEKKLITNDPFFKLGMRFGKTIGKRKVRREYASNGAVLSDKEISKANNAIAYLNSQPVKEMIGAEILKIAPAYDQENVKTFASYMRHSYGVKKSLDKDKMRTSGKSPVLILKPSVTTKKAMDKLMDIIIPTINSHIKSKFDCEIHQSKTDKYLYNIEYVGPKSAFESATKSSLYFETPKELHTWMKNNFSYTNFTTLLSPDEMAEKKSGSCHDQALFAYTQLKKMGLKPKLLFFIAYKEGEVVGGMTHTLCYYWKDNKVWWFETAWNGAIGLRSYPTENAMRVDIFRRYMNLPDAKKFPELEFKEISPEKPGVNLSQYVDKALEVALATDERTDFGIPSLKKYPMPDPDHVKAAIRMFNHVDDEHEEELANNILKYIKKYKMSDINVGKENRFHKYYSPSEDAVITDVASQVPYGGTIIQRSMN